MKKALTLVVLAVLIIRTGCAGHKTMTRQTRRGGTLPGVMEEPGLTKLYLQTIGIGSSDASLPATQRKATAREAAIVMAQKEMLSILKGTTIKGNITVERAMEKSSRVEAQVNGLLKGARVIKTEWLKDGSAVVILQLDFQGPLADRIGITDDLRM